MPLVFDGSLTVLFADFGTNGLLGGTTLVEVAYDVWLADSTRRLQYTVGWSTYDALSDTEDPKALAFSTSPPFGQGSFVAKGPSNFFCQACNIPQVQTWTHVRHVWNGTTVEFWRGGELVSRKEGLSSASFGQPMPSGEHVRSIMSVGGGAFGLGNLFNPINSLEGSLRNLQVSAQGSVVAAWPLDSSLQPSTGNIPLQTELVGTAKQRLQFTAPHGSALPVSALTWTSALRQADPVTLRLTVNEGEAVRVRLGRIVPREPLSVKPATVASMLSAGRLCPWPQGRSVGTVGSGEPACAAGAQVLPGDSLENALFHAPVGLWSPDADTPLVEVRTQDGLTTVKIVVVHVNRAPEALMSSTTELPGRADAAVDAAVDAVAASEEEIEAGANHLGRWVKRWSLDLPAQDSDDTFSQGRLFRYIVDFPRFGQLRDPANGNKLVPREPAATVRQWTAAVVNASSQWSKCGECSGVGRVRCGRPAGEPIPECASGWAVSNIVGEPDAFPAYGDLGQGWQTLAQEDPNEWIEVELAFAVTPTELESYEIFNPGGIVKVSGASAWFGTHDERTVWHTLWQGLPDPGRPRGESWIFKPEGMCPSPEPVKFLRLDMDHSLTPGWTNYDALKVVGTLTPPRGAVVGSHVVYEADPGVWQGSGESNAATFRASDCLAASTKRTVDLPFDATGVWRWANVSSDDATVLGDGNLQFLWHVPVREAHDMVLSKFALAEGSAPASADLVPDRAGASASTHAKLAACLGQSKRSEQPGARPACAIPWAVPGEDHGTFLRTLVLTFNVSHASEAVAAKVHVRVGAATHIEPEHFELAAGTVGALLGIAGATSLVLWGWGEACACFATQPLSRLAASSSAS